MTVSRSYDSETTKGGHADVVPLANEVIPYLAYALAQSTSSLVFPGEDGAMRSRHTPLEDVLRRAMRRAGIEHYDHVCRRKGCGHSERAQDTEVRRCQSDGSELWPKAVVRNIRFHGLRQTMASLLVQKGANLPAVVKIMRHTDPKITMQTYGHFDPAHLRAEIDKLVLATSDPEPLSLEQRAQAANGERFATHLLPKGASGDVHGIEQSEKNVGRTATYSGRGERIRTFGLLVPNQGAGRANA